MIPDVHIQQAVDLDMQANSLTAQVARPRQKSCTECRRRRQKCNPRKDGPCGNCAKRYPPVECIMPKSLVHSLRNPKFESEIDLSDTPRDSGSGHKDQLSFLSERPYISPDPPWRGGTTAAENDRLDSSRKIESEVRSSSSSARSKLEPRTYFEIKPMKRESDKNYLPTSGQNGTVGSPRALGGVLTAISSINSPAIKPTPKNTKLFYLFSIDGQGVLPVLFVDQMLPWMIQSPPMPNIAILMASYTQVLEQGLHVPNLSETLSIKAHVLSLINAFLKQDFDLVGGEALRAVIHLVILEWFWGANASLWAHMKGLKQMIKLRGGFEGMGDPLLVQVLILTDYEVACCFERDLFLEPPPSANEEVQAPASYSVTFSSPLLSYEVTFRQSRSSLGLGIASAEMLDDVRRLTLSIISDPTLSNHRGNIQLNASLTNRKLHGFHVMSILPSEIDPVYDTIRIAALIYNSCIVSLTPFCTPTNTGLLQELHDAMSQVTLSQWKKIPGIFLWVLLIAAPSSENDAQGRFLKKKKAVAGMSIGLEDFGLAIAHLRSFWKVQRWIAQERREFKTTEESSNAAG